MTQGAKSLEFRFAKSNYGFSVHRLREHTELGQLNVFSQAISARREMWVIEVFGVMVICSTSQCRK